MQEKLKEICQKFSVAVTSGRRSGSGKIILEFYDQLVQIWGGSPATEPLSAGICTQDINSVNVDDHNQREGQDPAALFDEYDDGDDDDGLGPAGGASPCSDEEPDPSASVSSGKRKSSSPIPKLIDDKRKHPERN